MGPNPLIGPPSAPKWTLARSKSLISSSPDGLIAARIAWPTEVFFEKLVPKHGVLGYLVADRVDLAYPI